MLSRLNVSPSRAPQIRLLAAESQHTFGHAAEQRFTDLKNNESRVLGG
jgi:hypothetical protein